MKKANHLADYLTKAVPGLAKNPERLFVAIDKGRLVSVNGYLSHRWVASVTVTLLDTPVTDLVSLGVVLLRWAARHQPELLRHPKSTEAFAFNVEMLDRLTCDVSFELELEQLVSMTARSDGGFDVVERDEPDPDPGFEHLGGFKPDSHLVRLVLGDDQIIVLEEP